MFFLRKEVLSSSKVRGIEKKLDAGYPMIDMRVSGTKLNVSEFLQLNENIRHSLRLERLIRIWKNGIVEYWKVGF